MRTNLKYVIHYIQSTPVQHTISIDCGHRILLSHVLFQSSKHISNQFWNCLKTELQIALLLNALLCWYKRAFSSHRCAILHINGIFLRYAHAHTSLFSYRKMVVDCLLTLSMLSSSSLISFAVSVLRTNHDWVQQFQCTSVWEWVLRYTKLSKHILGKKWSHTICSCVR